MSKAGHRRQLIEQGADVIHNVECRELLETGQADALGLASGDRTVKAAKRLACIGALQIILLAEHALPAGLALPLGERAKGIEPPGDGGGEALLAGDIAGHHPEKRCGCLVRAMGAAKALNGGIRAPARLEEIVMPPGLVSRLEIGVIGPAGAAGAGEHQDVLLATLERGGLGGIGRGGVAGFDHQAAELPLALVNGPLGASGDLGDRIGTEGPDNLIEGGRNGRQQRQFLDQRVACRDSLTRQDRLSVLIDDGLGGDLVVLGVDHPVQRHWEAVHEVGT